MKKLVLFFALFVMVVNLSVSCKMAPSTDMGDTLAAQEFEPIDTTLQKQEQKTVQIVVADSADIFVIGDGSTRELLQLVSYPSRRDTASFGKQRPIKVTGSADYGRIVRVGFVYGKDSVKLVKTIDEIKIIAPNMR